MRRELKNIWEFVKNHFKNRVRTKKFLIWVIITPMLLIGFLNLIGGEDEIDAKIAVLDEDRSEISNLTMSLIRSEDRLDMREVGGFQEGIDMLKDGDVDAFFVIPEDFSDKWSDIRNDSEYHDTIALDVYHLRGAQEDLIRTILKGVTADINEFVLGEDMEKPVELVSRPLDLGERDWSYTDLLLPSGMMIVILQSGFFASSDNASALTEAMLDKRLGMSPVSSIYPISGMIIMDALFTTLAGLIALVSGLALFQIALPPLKFLLMIPLIFSSSLLFSYMGNCIGKLSSDRAATQGLSSMVVFPLVFFSQAYLFSTMFPDYVILISKFLPIYPAADVFKNLLISSPSISYVGIRLGQSFIWLIGVLIIFIYLYRD